jgi:hypothetical protein
MQNTKALLLGALLVGMGTVRAINEVGIGLYVPESADEGFESGDAVRALGHGPSPLGFARLRERRNDNRLRRIGRRTSIKEHLVAAERAVREWLRQGLRAAIAGQSPSYLRPNTRRIEITVIGIERVGITYKLERPAEHVTSSAVSGFDPRDILLGNEPVLHVTARAAHMEDRFDRREHVPSAHTN